MKEFLPALAFAVLLLPGHAGDLEQARVIYSQLCFNCHGPKLDGGIGPALNDTYWQHGSSPQAILEAINQGIPGTEMIGYEAVFPEADRIALRDFILSKQEGLRETLRGVYPREFFKGKRLTRALFESVESSEQKSLPENVYYLDRNQDGVLRGTAKLYIREPGDYQFAIRPVGRTTIVLDGQEVHYSDEKTDRKTHINQVIPLAPGVYPIEILHEEKTTHTYRFHGTLDQLGSDKRIPLTGRSLEGSVPRVVQAGPQQARVVRKWIDGLPPRALLCLLPNKVIVAYSPEDGAVLQAWHSAEVNQTPSLSARSQKPSEIRGTEITEPLPQGLKGEHIQFLHYEAKGMHIHVVSRVDGGERTLVLAPEGEQSFSITID